MKNLKFIGGGSLATIEGRNPVMTIKNDREIDKIMIANSAKESSIKK